MYVFNKIKVNPQLPKRIARMSEIARNLWWAWNTEYLKLFKLIDSDLWEFSLKNPVKFLNMVTQEKLEEAEKNSEFLKEYDKVVQYFDDYMSSKSTWFAKHYPNNKEDVIAYFSAEYGLDETIPIYSGGLGILSGDHLKSASDLGLPFVAVGLLYKNGYFHQRINGYGDQENEYQDIYLKDLPIQPVLDEKGEELVIYVRFPKKKIYLKVWKIEVGRVTLYLLDSDIEQNGDEYRDVTLKLYGGDRETRIQQEIILGMAGVHLLNELGIKPTIYHMNEGHSSFVTLELMKDIISEKKISFEMAKDIVSAKTVFTTHTPVPAGNDIFDVSLVEKYFKTFWPRLNLNREEFLRLGMKPEKELAPGFNMGILALQIAGKRNGVSKLHGAVSRELFSDVWPNISPNESPITHVTNGIHTCYWLAPTIKDLYNKYLTPYWQENIHEEQVWKKINSIPNDKLWNTHQERKQKLISLVKENVTARLKRSGKPLHEITEMVSNLTEDCLIIGFARRFATYKRANLIFRDLERITKILNDNQKPIRLIFAGKAHPADKEGQDLIKNIHEISMMPQFRGKVFVIEDYSIAIARYLVSGVDVWLNNPRRPMEASGTSGQKAAVNGVINFSILDGWWAEGYNQKNGWAIGRNSNYESYEIQDKEDSESIYNILENKIIPAYYNKNNNGISDEWLTLMKNSITGAGARFSTARMLVDYTENLYMPLIEVTKKYYDSLEEVAKYEEFKRNLYLDWEKIQIEQPENLGEITIDAGNRITVGCKVQLPNIDVKNIVAQAYVGKILNNGIIEDIQIVPMTLVHTSEEDRSYSYTAELELKDGGNYGYTFRVMPKHEMLLDSENLNLVKWITK